MSDIVDAKARQRRKKTALPEKQTLWRACSGDLEISVAGDASFTVRHFGKLWFKSVGAALYRGGNWYHTVRSKPPFLLMQPLGVRIVPAMDALGSYRMWEASFDAGGTAFKTSIRIYDDKPCLVFAHELPAGAADTQIFQSAAPPGENANEFTPSTHISTAFPALVLSDRLRRTAKFLSWDDVFTIAKKYDCIDDVPGSTEGGSPLVIVGPKLRTVVLSPMNHFYTGLQVRSKLLESDIACGVSGEVTNLPASFRQETILFAGSGVTDTVFDWGSQLLLKGGKRRGAPNEDLTVNYLGYATDNGAGYYFSTEPGLDYHQTLLGVKAYLKQSGVPARWFQIDAWRHTPAGQPKPGKEADWQLCAEGLATWEPLKEVFPKGQLAFHNDLQMPQGFHGWFFSAHNEYIGRYRFLPGVGAALPVDPQFWQDFMRWLRRHGNVMYEQDAMNWISRRCPQIRTDVDVGQEWLSHMDAAARANGIRIQYCMTLPADALASTLFPSVTQLRASNDYSASTNRPNDQWHIGISSLFLWALGLAPFKDGFWTTPDQPGNPKYDRERDTLHPDLRKLVTQRSGRIELNADLQAAVSALSSGPVWFGDRIGLTDKTLLMRTCRADGLIPKPDKPATPIDRSFGTKPPEGEIWHTLSRINRHTFHYVLSVQQVSRDYPLTAADLQLDGAHISFDLSTHRLAPVGKRRPYSTLCRPPTPHGVSHKLSLIAPQSAEGLAFLGEIGKFVPVSRQRFTSISSDMRAIKLSGVPGETVELAWFCPSSDLISAVLCGDRSHISRCCGEDWSYDASGKLLRVRLTMPESGTAIVLAGNH